MSEGNAADDAYEYRPRDVRELVSGSPYVVNGVEQVNDSNLNAICLRQFPLASIMRSLKMKINQSTETAEPYRYIHALGRYNLDDDQQAYEMFQS